MATVLVALFAVVPLVPEPPAAVPVAFVPLMVVVLVPLVLDVVSVSEVPALIAVPL